MCGRYTHLLTWSKIAELYRLTLPDEEPKGLTPNYNVAPTTVMPIIRPAGNGRGLVMELTRSISLASRNSPAAGVAGRALSRTSHPAASWHGRGSTWIVRLLAILPCVPLFASLSRFRKPVAAAVPTRAIESLPIKVVSAKSVRIPPNRRMNGRKVALAYQSLVCPGVLQKKSTCANTVGARRAPRRRNPPTWTWLRIAPRTRNNRLLRPSLQAWRAKLLPTVRASVRHRRPYIHRRKGRSASKTTV